MYPEIVPAEERIAHYEATLTGERLPKNLEGRTAYMVEKFATWVNDIVPREQIVHDILEEEAIPSNWYFGYQAFLREAYRNRIDGGTPDIAVSKTKWMARGLDEDILDRIITEAVEWDPP